MIIDGQELHDFPKKVPKKGTGHHFGVNVLNFLTHVSGSCA